MRNPKAVVRRGPLGGAGARRRLLLAFSLAVLFGCATRPAAPPPIFLPPGELRGTASWYGDPYHGRKTANGERYDMEDLTAAHRTLPFNSRVRVERLDNGRRVEVRINDRGPFIEGRVIDLSKAAARRLGMLRAGVAPVRLDPLEIPPGPAPRWTVLVGGFAREASARRLVGRIRGPRARVVRGWHGDPRNYHVRVGGVASQAQAQELAERLRREGYNAFWVRNP